MEDPEINSYSYNHINVDKNVKKYIGKKITVLKNSTRESECLHIKE